jgi:putative transposase
MNRTSSGIVLFEDAGDYQAFERVLAEALARQPSMRLCDYCEMPNHFHLVLWPRGDGELSRFMQWLTMTHTQRWHAHRHSTGHGHLYQSRFKSFAIQQDEHFLSVCRYVERNPLRANLVRRAQDWPYSSMAARLDKEHVLAGRLCEWPVERPRDWVNLVNQPQNEDEVAALKRAMEREQPFGSEQWALRTARRLGVESSLRPRGRPRKERDK